MLELKIKPEFVGAVAVHLDPAKGHYYADGTLYVPDEAEQKIVKQFAPDAEAKTVANLRTARISDVDKDAEAARLRHITPGIGQALTYQAKAEEIRRYDADANPVKADYPFLASEIGITGPSLTAVADVVRGAIAAWSATGAEIERVRLKAKADLTKADTLAKIEDIVSAIEWP